MNRKECYQLLGEMLGEDYNGEARRLGDGREWVVVINDVFLWNKADWRKYKKGKLASMEAVQEMSKVL